ncbi:glycoside hydrolase family 30 protein [Amylocarpus encephaloides]|uniref:Glycoside hydrolase family 30 protein n=1 Tax=Amylocarpus encephaloides TaxID=45428 RepID=A0A9P8C3Q2_9HELO|nr:glycoside hydrolase family 30 protein [Amylocarpus encephaloides]
MHVLRLLPLVLSTSLLASPSPSWHNPPLLSPRQSTSSLTVDLTKRYQTIDGFGFSEAFQRANTIVNLPATKQRELLDIFFDPIKGAGFTILRNGIGSSPDSSSDHMNSIAPKSPGSPTATPNYVWDGKDSGQLFVSKEAWKYGVRNIYANAWSAPGYMKTNGNENYGGYLCGVSGQRCASGDWKQAFADYLVRYLRYYREEGVEVSHLGFLNEPEFGPSYAGMLSSGTQAADFIKILAPTLIAANFSSVGITCCDAEGWSHQSSMTSQLQSAGVESKLSTITSHSYTSSPNFPLSTTRRVWQTEYADLQGAWQAAFYSYGGAGEGLRWAGLIHSALVNANCSAYLYWIGAQGGATNSKLVRIENGNYIVSKRLWAFGQFSRSARPGAVRVGVSGAPYGVQASAYLNTDGKLAVVIINTGASAVKIAVDVKGGWKTSGANAWVTDNSNDMSQIPIGVTEAGVFSATVPGRGMASYVVVE